MADKKTPARSAKAPGKPAGGRPAKAARATTGKTGTKPASAAKTKAKAAAKPAAKPKAKAAPKTKSAPKPAPKPGPAPVKDTAPQPAPDPAVAAAASLGLLGEADLERLETVSRNLMQSALKSQKLMSDVMRRSLEGDPSLMPKADPLHAAPELIQAWDSVLSDPEALLQAQSDLYRGYIDLWSATNKRLLSGEEPAPPPALTPEPGDKRWRSSAWSEHPVFDAIKHSYLINQRFMLSLLANAKGLDAAARRKVNFVT
ncbi:MAG: class I poly(R)-hydroxyalkanoic acid synthase, partial [Oceanicaulis sp.]|nr:class I poly(R)-hydroxyalkanoic acid synthase [Oceanicaulis sp.]